jgi:hypothetical protein
MKDQSVLFIVIALFIVFFLISKLLGIEMASGAKKKGKNEVCKKDKVEECDTKLACRERKDGKEKGFTFCLPK